jgi:hypothetical protein
MLGLRQSPTTWNGMDVDPSGQASLAGVRPCRTGAASFRLEITEAAFERLPGRDLGDAGACAGEDTRGAKLLAGAQQHPDCRDPHEVRSRPTRAMARGRALAL